MVVMLFNLRFYWCCMACFFCGLCVVCAYVVVGRSFAIRLVCAALFDFGVA